MKLLKQILATAVGQLALRGLIILLLTTGVFLAVFLSGDRSVRLAADGCFAGFGIAFCSCFFSFGDGMGWFDSVIYGGSYIFGSVGRYYRLRNGGTYGDFVETRRNKHEKRSFFPYIPYAVIGVLWLIAALVLLGIVGSPTSVVPPSISSY